MSDVTLRLAVTTPWRYFVASGPEREMRRRELRRENAEDGGGGGFLEVEYSRVMQMQL